MRIGKAIPVWYPEEDRQRVEEAAALAGYKHLSKYIRDKSLGRSGPREPCHDSMQAWVDRQEWAGRLAEIECNQRSAQALLAMLLFLVHKKASAGETKAMLQACENADMPTEMLAAAIPQLAALVLRFSEER